MMPLLLNLGIGKTSHLPGFHEQLHLHVLREDAIGLNPDHSQQQQLVVFGSSFFATAAQAGSGWCSL